MAGIKIGDLPELSGAPDNGDYLVVVDTSVDTTKKISLANLIQLASVFDSSEVIDLLTNKGVTSILPAADSAYDLGSSSRKWKDLYLSGNSIYLGDVKLSANELIREVDNVAFMVADTSLFVGQKVRTKGYWTAGDGGATLYEIVAADTGTADGGSYINLSGISGQAKAYFENNEVTAHQFGAHGDSLTPSQVTSRLQAMFNYTKDSEIVCKAWGSYNVNDRLYTNSNLEMSEAFLYYESDYSDFYSFIVTPSVQDSANGPTYFDITSDTVPTPAPGKWNTNDILRYKRFNFPRVIREHANADWWGPNNTVVQDGTHGITMINCINTTSYVPHVEGFNYGLFCWGRDSSGFVHNNIDLGLLVNNQKGLSLFAGNSGWANQNVFVNGQIAINSNYADSAGAGYRRDGTAMITLSGTGDFGQPNNNTFVGTSLEGFVDEFAINNNGGGNNMWINCRFEAGLGTKRAYFSGASAQYNQILYGHTSNLLELTEANGARNNTIMSTTGIATSLSSNARATFSGNNTFSGSNPVFAAYAPTLTATEYTVDNYNISITANGINMKQAGDAQPKITIEPTGAGAEINAGDGTATPTRYMFFTNGETWSDANFNLYNHAWNNNLLKLGNYRLWVDGTGKLRIRSGAPTSDTDGTVVGTQT